METLWQYAEAALNAGGHDLEHVRRVYVMALKLARQEGLSDTRVLEAAAILHDIARPLEDADATGTVDHAALGADMAARFMADNGFSDEQCARARHAIRAHRFKGEERPDTLEARILSDADKLDSIGAVAVARCFMLAGEYGEQLWSDADVEQYKRDNIGPSGRVKDMRRHAPNLEYQLKLRNIPARLYTASAKAIAAERMRRMDGFFAQLKGELEETRDGVVTATPS